LETEASLIEETSANALNASEEAHEMAKRAVDTASQVTDDIRLLDQRYVQSTVLPFHLFPHWRYVAVVVVLLCPALSSSSSSSASVTALRWEPVNVHV